jgi:hypothetical protein
MRAARGGISSPEKGSSTRRTEQLSPASQPCRANMEDISCTAPVPPCMPACCLPCRWQGIARKFCTPLSSNLERWLSNPGFASARPSRRGRCQLSRAARSAECWKLACWRWPVRRAWAGSQRCSAKHPCCRQPSYRWKYRHQTDTAWTAAQTDARPHSGSILCGQSSTVTVPQLPSWSELRRCGGCGTSCTAGSCCPAFSGALVGTNWFSSAVSECRRCQCWGISLVCQATDVAGDCCAGRRRFWAGE